jgi:long-chain fatty acid transport protein
MQLRRGSRYWLTLAVLTYPAVAAHAQGFGLNEISTCGIGRGYSVVATGCRDASAVYWNPAATATLQGWSVLAGASVILIDGKFEQDTTFRTFKGDVPAQWVPHAFVNYHNPNSKASWGIGAYVPYGLTSQWHDDFPGRFSAKKAALKTIYVQPNVSWQINSKWNIGAGPVIGHSSVELIQSIDLSQQVVTGQAFTFAALGVYPRTEFARARLSGSAWGYGVHVGIQGKLSPNWMVGARYLTPITFKYDDADATFTQVSTGLTLAAGNPLSAPAGTPVDALVSGAFTTGPLVSQKVSTKITHPEQLQVGFAYSGWRNWEVEADYAYVGYHQFRELPINFSNSGTPDRTLIEDFNNSSAIRLGAEYRLSNDVHLRAGFAGVTRAAPNETVTPLLPEQDRANYTLGVSVPIFTHWAVDGGYVLVTTPGRRGRIDERISRSQTATQLNTGVYSLTAHILALSLKGSF